MLYKKSRLFVILLLSILMVAASVIAVSATTRNTDVTMPRAGNSLVLVSGSFESANVEQVLNLVNSFRMEACKNGYPDPNNRSRKLTMSDYSPVKWSGDLEWIAQTRAAEGIVFWNHDRPNGTSCFTCKHNGISSDGECLAWSYGDLISGIDIWYMEKAFWLEEDSPFETGHYTVMIDPNTKYIGIGCFRTDGSKTSCTAGAFSSSEDLSEQSNAVSGKYKQWMEVQNSRLSGLSLSGNSKVVVGQSANYNLSKKVTYEGGWADNNKISTPVLVQGSDWKVSNSSIASIDSNGKLQAKKIGKVTITGKDTRGKTASKTVNIVKPYKGAVLNIKGAKYKITKLNKEVSIIGTTSTANKITIPATVKYRGKKYKVVSVGTSAFSDNKNITSLVIGKNVKSIGKKAFYKCSALTTVNIKTKRLKASKVGAGSFKATSVISVKCPKAKKKAYKKFLVKKGISKSAEFK